MNDQAFETVKYLTIGILIGYFGKYALAWMKTWKADKNSENTQENQKQN